ncbi:hypothetical protein K432DRAFT_423857 [Lepidopterella palustris CBS 459.81]|uniref:Uncharacterized protein n=1 Tax=Lepidopterella palustris CBS 459.81 TaxID=1314670 RepID=A0A8E2EFG7_9PEZI|nr:hypothetical protein K432DRAFT_423857 [Lepidopterella palustris CBS 459.81]
MAEKFKWTVENERKLLLLILGRVPSSDKEYKDLLPSFPGTNLNGVKIRVSRLRVEQRKLLEQVGTELPADAKSRPATTKFTTGRKPAARKTALAIQNEPEIVGEPAEPTNPRKRGRGAVKKPVDSNTEEDSEDLARGTSYNTKALTGAGQKLRRVEASV